MNLLFFFKEKKNLYLIDIKSDIHKVERGMLCYFKTISQHKSMLVKDGPGSF